MFKKLGSLAWLVALALALLPLAMLPTLLFLWLGYLFIQGNLYLPLYWLFDTALGVITGFSVFMISQAIGLGLWWAIVSLPPKTKN